MQRSNLALAPAVRLDPSFPSIRAREHRAGASDPPLFGMGVIFAVAGFCTGFVAPQRDMMIRSITPPGQMGKVFAFVSTGFNVGGVIAPLIYGWVLDHSDARNIFWATAVLALLTMVTVLVTGMERRRVTAQG